MHDIDFVLFADCSTEGATCTSQKCTAPGSVADGGDCTTTTGKAPSLVAVLS